VRDMAAFERSPLVNELDKHDVRFAMAALLPIDDKYSAMLCLMRARRDGRYSVDLIDRLARLVPHIRRAAALHIRLGRLESQLSSLNALVDRLAAPVLLTDRTGALRYANSSGQEALRQARYLTLRDGQVRPRSLRQEGHFANLLATALAEDGTFLPVESESSMRLFDIEGHGATLTISALRGQPKLLGLPQAEAILFLIYTDEKSPTSASRLQILFGLTPAETRLAELLLGGKTLMDISEQLGLSRETLKSQLRSLFFKTRTSRQGELVALLLSSISIQLA